VFCGFLPRYKFYRHSVCYARLCCTIVDAFGRLYFFLPHSITSRDFVHSAIYSPFVLFHSFVYHFDSIGAIPWMAAIFRFSVQAPQRVYLYCYTCHWWDRFHQVGATCHSFAFVRQQPGMGCSEYSPDVSWAGRQFVCPFVVVWRRLN